MAFCHPHPSHNQWFIARSKIGPVPKVGWSANLAGTSFKFNVVNSNQISFLSHSKAFHYFKVNAFWNPSLQPIEISERPTFGRTFKMIVFSNWSWSILNQPRLRDWNDFEPTKIGRLERFWTNQDWEIGAILNQPRSGDWSNFEPSKIERLDRFWTYQDWEIGAIWNQPRSGNWSNFEPSKIERFERFWTNYNWKIGALDPHGAMLSH